MYSVGKIKELINGEGILPKPETMIENLSIDSRRIALPESTIFFALEGPKRSGSNFLSEAYEKGIRNFVVKRGTSADKTVLSANVIFVEDTLIALQQLAARHRSQFHYPVIAITGSNGKTIVKEWLSQLLSPHFRIVKSPKSYNSQVGVPLSVWEMSESDQLAIFEAGISKPGEMSRLEEIIRPTIGIFTNIGNAHAENFVDKQTKANEKALLFRRTDTVIIPSDSCEISNALRTGPGVLTWGIEADDDLRIIEIRSVETNTDIIVFWNGKEMHFRVPFSGKVHIYNALLCIAVLLFLGLQPSQIQSGLSGLRNLDMRLQLMNANNNCTLINDSYSFDTSAFTFALDFLMQQNQHEKKTLILSDLPSDNQSHYEKVMHLINASSLYRVFSIGPVWSQIIKWRKPAVSWFAYTDVQSFTADVSKIHFANEVILMKGARVFGFEKIVSLLQLKSHSTRLEINLSALTHNLNFYRSRLEKGVKMMVMVKAFAYGSGSAQVASLLQFHKVDYLAVAYADEGVELRKSGIHLPILVLNVNEEVFETLLQFDLEPELFSIAILKKFADFLKENPIPKYSVHLKLDTGMHRLGFEENDIGELVTILLENPKLNVQSVFSHFAASDDPAEREFTHHQAATFKRIVSTLQNRLGYKFLCHISNSAAIVSESAFQYDMVRLGIGLYGIETALVAQKNLQTAISLKTTVAQLRSVKSGETIGYNRRGRVKKDSLIATIRIGYADGFKRQLSNGIGQVYIRGCFAPVIGIISMDMTMVDVTGIEGVTEDDEVEIFGENIGVQEIATVCGTIPYEILTGISQRVKRVYLEE